MVDRIADATKKAMEDAAFEKALSDFRLRDQRYYGAEAGRYMVAEHGALEAGGRRDRPEGALMFSAMHQTALSVMPGLVPGIPLR